MTTTPAPAAALLVELTHRGFELQARGDRLRYRPRSAMTPELAERVKVHKPALLTLLRADHAAEYRPPQPAQNGQNRPMAAVAPQAGRVGRPNAPEHGESCSVPHEPSLAERVESGYVNPGWTPTAWADRLRQLADRCEALRPNLAGQYRMWATNVLKNEKGLA
jgi:hypothetical protein